MTLTPHRGGFVIFATFVIAMILAVFPIPEWALLFRPHWVGLVLVYWCIALPERVGVGIGWIAGITLDVSTGTLLGQHALGLAIIAYLAVRLHQRTRVFPLWQQALTVFVLFLVERLLSLWAMGASGQATPSLWYWAPPVVSMFLWPWMYIILRDVRRRFSVS